MNKQQTILRLLLTMALLTSLFAPDEEALGAPARRDSVALQTRDGKLRMVTLYGDEWYHFMADTAGHVIRRDTLGRYYEATLDTLQEKVAMAKADAKREALGRQLAERRASRHTRADNFTDGSHYFFPTVGEVTGLIVLVEYQDIKFTIDDPKTHYEQQMMADDYHYTRDNKYTHYGSAHQYFYENSLGKFNPTFEVYGPLTLAHSRSYYGGNNDKQAYEMIVEATAQLAEQGIDFSRYDNDGDGVVDFVFAIFAGEGENSVGVTEDAVWPHFSSLQSADVLHDYYVPVGKDSLQVNDYACTCELVKGLPDGVGTFCHEFGHILGLPDIYDLNYIACTPLKYDVMDSGEYNHYGYHPAGYTAYERYELGWLQPTVLTSDGTYQLHDFGTTNEAYLFPVGTTTTGDPRDGEYYLFENRQQTAWDQYIPGHGLLIWHIDYSPQKWLLKMVNTWVNHQCVDLIEADGKKRITTSSGSEEYTTNASTPFPGTANHTSFTSTTDPAFLGWAQPGVQNATLNKALGKALVDIQEMTDATPAIIEFAFQGDEESSITTVTAVNAVPAVYLQDGRLYLSTPLGTFDVLGRKTAAQ